MYFLPLDNQNLTTTLSSKPLAIQQKACPKRFRREAIPLAFPPGWSTRTSSPGLAVSKQYQHEQQYQRRRPPRQPADHPKVLSGPSSWPWASQMPRHPRCALRGPSTWLPLQSWSRFLDQVPRPLCLPTTRVLSSSASHTSAEERASCPKILEETKLLLQSVPLSPPTGYSWRINESWVLLLLSRLLRGQIQHIHVQQRQLQKLKSKIKEAFSWFL